MNDLPSGTPLKAQLRLDAFYGMDTSQAEANMEIGFSPKALNCCTDKQTLEHAKGFEELEIPVGDGAPPDAVFPLVSKINRIGYYHVIVGGFMKRYLVAVNDSGAVYMLQINNDLRRWEKVFISQVSSYNMKDCDMAEFRQGEEDWLLLFSRRDRAMRIYDGAGYYLADKAPKAGSACVHYERVFVCDIEDEPYNVRFSGSMDCTDWSSADAGYITVVSDMGALVKVVTFADAIYIFHQYGISRLDAHARHTEFAVTPVWKTPTEIIPGSIVNCGDRIIFATRKGLYRFNGASIAKVCRQAEGLWDEMYYYDKMSACIHDHQYMMFCNTHLLNEGYEDENNTLIKYNLEKGTMDVSTGFNVGAVKALSYPGYEGLVISIGDIGELYAYSGVMGQAEWRSPFTDLGHPDITKRVTDVYLNASGTGELELSVYADDRVTVYPVQLKEDLQIIRVKVKGMGKRIAVGITKAEGKFNIESIQLKMDYIRDGV